MPSYVTLFNWTEQGVKTVKQLDQRIADAERAAAQLGAKLKDIYVVMGRYDIVAIWEAPNDEAAAKLALAISMKGNSRSETLRAFTRQEFGGITGGLP
ncbi:MAG: GYD domain-containing protein [Dehalococcoidia bacterium]